MIRILSPGLLTTVQDTGRIGYQRYGVIVGGAMDEQALRIGNLLVGNPQTAAALEMTLHGPGILFESDALIAVTGDGMNPVMNGVEMPRWRQICVPSGSTLQFRSRGSGCRAYLAIAGGIQVQAVMGSRSTYVRAGIGGFQGRALQTGDVLAIGHASEFARRCQSHLLAGGAREPIAKAASWFPSHTVLPDYRVNPILRVVPGGQRDWFDDESQNALQTRMFQVTPQSDRMGYRLSGSNLTLKQPKELISEAVTSGTIQVPPDGNPIVLMADRQTTGGYPKIAQIATVDLPVMAQVRPGQSIGFEFVTVEEAQRLLKEQHRELREFERGLRVLGY